MSKSIEKRIEKIEQVMSMDKGPKTILVILMFDRLLNGSNEGLGDIDEWESKKQVLERYKEKSMICFHADPNLEREARKRPLTQDELALLVSEPNVA